MSRLYSHPCKDRKNIQEFYLCIGFVLGGMRKTCGETVVGALRGTLLGTLRVTLLGTLRGTLRGNATGHLGLPTGSNSEISLPKSLFSRVHAGCLGTWCAGVWMLGVSWHARADVSINSLLIPAVFARRLCGCGAHTWATWCPLSNEHMDRKCCKGASLSKIRAKGVKPWKIACSAFWEAKGGSKKIPFPFSSKRRRTF